MTAWMTLPQAGVVAGQAGHVSDHDLIEPALATLWGAAMQSFYNVCAPPYSADPTGATDATAAIQAAINAAFAAGGGVVCFPQGTFLVTPTGSPATGLNLSGMQGVRLVGSGALTSVIKKNGNGVLINMSGPSTDTTGATHCKYCSIESLGLNGNTLAGLAVQCYYADNLFFRDVRTKDNYDICIDSAEFWDSRFYNCVWETSGSLTNLASTPNVMLRNSAAASGFGTSTDNVNQIHFTGCRWEDFRQGAVWIQQGVSSTNNENGIFFSQCKMESSFIRGGPHLLVDSSARGIFVDELYCFSGGFGGTYNTATDVIQWSPQFSALENVWISDRAGTSSVLNGVTVNSVTATDNIKLTNVRGVYNQAPTGAHVNFGGTNTGDYDFDNVSSNTGTQWGGTIPTGFGANSPLNQVAGAVQDSSFSATPLDGTLGLDTTNRRLYVRENSGNWNFIPIKTLSSAVTSTTTINTTGLQTLQTATVPANDPQTASVYEVHGHGIYTTTTGSNTLTLGVYWGGIAGTLITPSPPAIAMTASLTNFLFEYEAKVTFRSSTSCVVTLKVYIQTATGGVTSTYLVSPGTTETVTTTSASALAIGATWNNASNSISCQGGWTEKIR